MLDSLGAESLLIRSSEDWKDFESRFREGERVGMVIPGGESTAMLRIMRDQNILLSIREAVKDGLPVFGTCAGMILLAKEVVNDSRERLATMNIKVLRNAYGRQLGSFYTESTVRLGDESYIIPMTFIRAPYITEVSEGVEVLAVVDGNIVAAREQNQLVCSFHPELNTDTHFHEFFLKMF